MMQVAKRFELSVLLISLCSLQIEGRGKTGCCPPERNVVSKIIDKSSWCHDDSCCPGDKLCCPHDTGKVCKTPAADRPGTCPKTTEKGEKCDDKCSADSECSPGLKCCMMACGFDCVPSLEDSGYPANTGEKPGTCPPTINCFVASHQICDNDKQCSADEKCCRYDCGNTCLNKGSDGKNPCRGGSAST
ncbi:uncharacterized protein O3C94_020504 [Discoglossus pictus]